MSPKIMSFLARTFRYGLWMSVVGSILCWVSGCQQEGIPSELPTFTPIGLATAQHPASSAIALTPTAVATITAPPPLFTSTATRSATSTPIATSAIASTSAVTPTPSTEFVLSTLGITVPFGVSIDIFAEGLNYPTALAFDDEGSLYVGINKGIYPYQPVGEILRLRDLDGDGKADETSRFASEIDRPVGLLFHEGELYLSQRGSVQALADRDGDGVAEQSRTLVTDIPAYGLHHNNSLVLGPDNYIYFTLGSTTNNGPEPDPLNGTVLRVPPDGGSLEIFASGFRNPFDLAFDTSGTLFATDNGCDPPACIDAPEELNHVVQGSDYGFPDYTGTPPEGSDSVGPIATFAPHTSANGMIIYQGSMFPEWQGQVFVALFGSYLEGFRDVGHRVLRVELTPTVDSFVGTVFPFADGLARPLDIAVAPDGSLFIADFEAGRIYRLYRP